MTSTTPLQPPGPERLLRFSQDLQRATTFHDLAEASRAEAHAVLGCSNAWFYVFEGEDVGLARLVAMSGAKGEVAWEKTPVLAVKGDAMLEEIVSTRAPVVVVDARTDPRTDKAQVAIFQLRTVINIPLHLVDKPYGVLGVGTFGDEPTFEPTPAQIDHLLNMANHLAVASARIRMVESRRAAEQERVEMERRLHQVQTLETLGLLAGGVAHDFNNLLLVMLASAHMLGESALTPTQREDLDALVAASHRGRDLIRQLMAMGRKQPLHMENVEPRMLLGQVGALLKRVLPASIGVEYRKGGAHPAVVGDAAQLNQVFMNLCLNARDAMPQGGTLTLGAEELVVDAANAAAHPWAQPGRYVVCTVKDTGVGMTPEIQRRVFEPFFSTKGELGTGLGLAVAYGIVRQHGGMLACTSEPGAGSTFSVFLPARAVTAAELVPGTQDPMPVGNERVLVADDEPLVRSAVTRLLEQAGYSVVAVESGVAACAAARLQAFDLVLLDAVMPGMNGRQAHDHLRVLLPRARFLFTSGHAAEALPPGFLQGLDVAVLTKPYNPPELWRAVREALR